MTFLITNDDGIESEGLLALVKWAVTRGEVIVAAPKKEQSARSHSISIKIPFEVIEVPYPIEGVRAISVDSSPADCIRAALDYLKIKVDVVFSGVNRGYNIGREIAYSGTDGAIFEAAYQGTKAVAWSCKNGHIDTAKQHFDRIWDYILDNKLFDYNNLYNVNIPIVPGDIVITSQGASYRIDHYDELGDNVIKNRRVAIEKTNDNIDNDVDAVLNDKISITPLSLERTNFVALEKLHALGL